MSGLARYRSAPSSYFTGFLGGGGGGGGEEDYAKLFNPGASSSETHRIFSRCMNATDLTSAAQHPPPPLPPRQKPSHRRRSGEHPPPMAPSRATNSGLIRQISSPAGLFDSILMEIDAGRFEEDCGNDSGNIPDSPWDDIDPALLSDDFLNRLAEEDSKIFAKPGAADDQGSEGENRRPARLSHHLSLPKSFANMSAVDKLLQDSVPCKLRAKRGRATHPRSIAERVRRNKISERMRKLQELVPNMDKQTNTADMLDFATDYIKDLQQEVKILSHNRAKCICSLKKEP